MSSDGETGEGRTPPETMLEFVPKYMKSYGELDLIFLEGGNLVN